MNKFVRGLVICALILCVALIMIAFILHEEDLAPDYNHTIIVNKSEKIPTAISNAVNCVQSKGFIITKIKVTKFNDKYFIRCGGKDLGNILIYDP